MQSAISTTLTAERDTIKAMCKTLSSVRADACELRKRIWLFLATRCGDRHEMIALQTADQAKHNTSKLEYLLEQNAQSHKPGKAPMSRRDRLALAIILASTSTVLHLDGCWLKAHWRSRDVLFLDLPSEQFLSSSDHEHAFLPWKISTDKVGAITSDDVISALMEAHRIRSAPLFALAPALIELCFEHPFSNLKEPEDDDPHKLISDLKTASRLLPFVSKESGLRDGDVVQRCLDCPFNVRVASLDNPDFRDAVSEHILMPPTDDLRDFDGRTS